MSKATIKTTTTTTRTIRKTVRKPRKISQMQRASLAIAKLNKDLQVTKQSLKENIASNQRTTDTSLSVLQKRIEESNKITVAGHSALQTDIRHLEESLEGTKILTEAVTKQSQVLEDNLDTAVTSANDRHVAVTGALADQRKFINNIYQRINSLETRKANTMPAWGIVAFSVSITLLIIATAALIIVW